MGVIAMNRSGKQIGPFVKEAPGRMILPNNKNEDEAWRNKKEPVPFRACIAMCPETAWFDNPDYGTDIDRIFDNIANDLFMDCVDESGSFFNGEELEQLENNGILTYILNGYGEDKNTEAFLRCMLPYLRQRKKQKRAISFNNQYVAGFRLESSLALEAYKDAVAGDETAWQALLGIYKACYSNEYKTVKRFKVMDREGLASLVPKDLSRAILVDSSWI